MESWALEGLSYRITGIVDDGDTVGLVEGSFPTITFSDHGLLVETGCNRLTGPYEIDSQGRLVANPVKTLKGCGEALTQQEGRLAQVFSGNPLVEVTGDTLTLKTDRIVIEATRA